MRIEKQSPSSSAEAGGRRALLKRLGAASLAVGAVGAFLPQAAAAQGRPDPRPDWPDFPRGWPVPFVSRNLARPGQEDDGPNGASTMRLVTVGAVNGGSGGSDFSGNNPGGDGLQAGMVAADTNSRRVFVMLRGAVNNTSYDVQFERFQDHNREDLGSVNTDDQGNFFGNTPNDLGGSNRVGTFVLTRNGNDQFAAALA
ncbi:MAG: hypothetical protein JO023_06215 [Chloroflexi bacterium]|nr:hypothetical protein [Chloroflexota bacterium]